MNLNQRIMAVALATVFALTPLFPSLITLTAVSVPGISIVPEPFVLVVLGVLALLALYGAIVLASPPRELPPLLLPLLAWLGAGALSAALGLDPRAGAIFLGILALGIVWHVALWRFFCVPGIAAAVLWSYLSSGALASVAAIAMVMLRWPAQQFAMEHGRAVGTFILPGELAGYLIIFIPIALAVAWRTQRRSLRALAICAAACGAVALGLTFSRAGWMGCAAALAFGCFALGPRMRRFAFFALAVGLAAVLVLFNAHHNPSENFTRLSIWRAAIAAIERFPLTGAGPFEFAHVYALVRRPDGDATAFHAHSFYLTVLAESGVVGALAVAWTWWRFARCLRAALRAAPPANATLAIAAAAGLFGTLVQGTIDTVTVVIFGMWFPTMALALAFARDGLCEPAI